MHMLTSLVPALLAFNTFATLVEAQEQDQQSLKIPRILNPNFVPNGQVAKQKVFRKFGWTSAPETYQKYSIPTTASGTTLAIPQENHAQYLSPVTIGGKIFNMDFDTGSSDLWVFSSSLAPDLIGQHETFNPNASTTFRPMQGSTWEIQYGDNTGAQGTVGLDVVTIGGVVAPNQAVEIATSVSPEFAQDAGCDGMLGLAFSSINSVAPRKQNTFFDNVKSRLTMPVFAANLEENGSGFFEFGAVDTTQYINPLTSVPINSSQGLWAFDSPWFSTGDGVKLNNVASSPAIVDTGTSLVVVDDVVARMYYSRIPDAIYSYAADGYIFPCDARLPPLTLAMGMNDFNVTIPGSLINFAQVSASYCYGGVQSNEGNPLQIFGDVLFRSAYVVFGMDYPISGLAIASKTIKTTDLKRRRAGVPAKTA